MRIVFGLVSLVLVLLVVGILTRQSLTSTTQTTQKLAAPPGSPLPTGSAPASPGQAVQQFGGQIERLTEQPSAQRNEESK